MLCLPRSQASEVAKLDRRAWDESKTPSPGTGKCQLLADIPSCRSVIPGKMSEGAAGGQSSLFIPEVHCVLPLKEQLGWNVECDLPEICGTWFLSPVLPLTLSLATGLRYRTCPCRSMRSARKVSSVPPTPSGSLAGCAGPYARMWKLRLRGGRGSVPSLTVASG